MTAPDGVTLESDPAEQGVIAVVGALRNAGMSQRAIVRELAARGIVSRGGRPLALSQVQRLLPRAG
jgi:hypothetical protein